MAFVRLRMNDPENPNAGWDMQSIDIRDKVFSPYHIYNSTSTSFNGESGIAENGGHAWFTGQGIVVDQDSIVGGWLDTARFTSWVESRVTLNKYYTDSFDIDFGTLISVNTIDSLPPLQMLKRVLAGDDEVTSTAADDALFDYRGNDLLDGGNGADRLDGGAGNDRLAGGNGDDRLVGRDGDDILIGSRGRDVLHGGEDQDTFIFNGVVDSVLGARRDVIQDFQTGIDKLDLSRIDANDDPSDGNQALVWIGSSKFTEAGQVRFANGILEINTDDHLHADFQLRIKTTIDEADLIV